MKRLILAVCLLASVPVFAAPQAKPAPVPAAVKYGSNPAAGKTFTHDGVTFYYEVYGTGEPLLVVHGNGGSISDLRAQIAYFRRRYKVIAMDSRDQGKSSDSTAPLTYEKMTEDLAALLDHLKTGPVNVLGWSDGGIEALLLGVRHPSQVKKIVAMAANLDPSERTVYPEVIGFVKQMLAEVPAAERNTPQGRRELKVSGLMLEEPHIDPKTLESITAPTLVIAGDHDVIRDEHTLEIYHHIANSQLAILPNSTHMAPWDDSASFNAIVDRFLRTPFVKKDRVADLMTSLEKLRSTK